MSRTWTATPLGGDDYTPTVKLVMDTRARDRKWPGVRKDSSKVHRVLFVSKPSSSKRRSCWVRLSMGGRRVKLFCDTGSRYMIIPPELYQDKICKLEEVDCNLRAWGADTPLDVKGLFEIKLLTKLSAAKTTKVYVVAGTRPEPLLGNSDAEDLGIISFNTEGRRSSRLRCRS